MFISTIPSLSSSRCFRDLTQSSNNQHPVWNHQPVIVPLNKNLQILLAIPSSTMGLFDFLGTSTPPVSIPTFIQGSGRDSTDLQIRSLLYLFQRLRINRLALFPAEGSLKYADGKLWDDILSGSDMSVPKLDGMYNLTAFEKLLLCDNHRVLIDFPKNKFRMLCILSEYPSANFSRPLSPTKFGASSDEMEDGFPVFKDYKERRVVNFSFSILPVDTPITARLLASELANSLLYVEHFSYVTILARYHIASKVVREVLGTSTEDAFITLSEDSKANLLFKYLTELAFIVQVIRIYDQYIKMEQPARPSSPTKLRSVRSYTNLPQSPSRVLLPTTPNTILRPLSPKKSLTNLRSSLTSRPSISNFNANEIYNPVAAPPSPEKRRNSGSGFGDSSLSYNTLYGREVRADLWEKSKNSIREKLAREIRQIEVSK